MKILFLSENYYPNLSGVPVVVKYLAEGLFAKGHDVAVATQCLNSEPSVDIVNGVRVFRFAIYQNKYHQYKGNISEYINFVLNYKADANIIECTQCITTDVLLPHISEIEGRVYFHSHGAPGLAGGFPLAVKNDLKHTIGAIYFWLRSKYYFSFKLKRVMKYFDATMCLSEADSSRNYLKKYSKKTYILDNAADDIFFNDNITNEERLSKYINLQNKNYVVSCANYQYVKNQIDMIKQYYQSEASKIVSLICIGLKKNDYYKECLSVVKDMEIEYGHRDVHLLVGVDRNDIPYIIDKASLYLVASRTEQYSISIIEAMSRGVPFISTDVGNARLLPGGVTISTIDDMHSTIDSLISDSIKQKHYSSEGRSFAYTYCRTKTVVNKLESIIQ